MNVKKEVAALERLTVNDLRERYAGAYRASDQPPVFTSLSFSLQSSK
jgi:hypothetical protein